MQLVEFNARKHYSEVMSWWKNQAWPILPDEFLPKNGFVVEVGEQMICAGWLYSTDSAFCWMEFVVGNPQISHTERGLGLDILIAGIQAKARDLKFKVIFTSIQNSRLLDRLTSKHDFVIGDHGMTNLTGRL